MGSSTPRLSVILPTYNAERHLRRCVNSILNQTFEDFELLVIDDGSTDHTIPLLDAYDDDRLRVIEREDATGITSALNRGIEEAAGEYVARHDADDWSAPERFERQVEYLDAHPDVALLGTGAHLVNDDGRQIERRRVLAEPALDDLIEQNHYVHGSVMMRRDALEAIDGYDEFFATTEDYDLWLRLAEEYPVRNIDEPLYYFRIHGDSIYGSKMKAVKLYHMLAILRTQNKVSPDLEENIEANGIDVVYDHLTIDQKIAYHVEMGQELIRYGELGEGRQHCLKALAFSKTNVMAYLMLVLSFLGSGAADFVARTYRKRVINPGIKAANDAA